MFEKSVDDRLSAWVQLRRQVEDTAEPFHLVAEFWSAAPFIPYNRNIDPYNRTAWPSPWQIIVDNIYDDFTLALMMAFSVKYTQRFKNTTVQVQTLLNENKTKMFNLAVIDNSVVLNLHTAQVCGLSDIPRDLLISNLAIIDQQL